MKDPSQSHMIVCLLISFQQSSYQKGALASDVSFTNLLLVLYVCMPLLDCLLF